MTEVIKEYVPGVMLTKESYKQCLILSDVVISVA